MKTKLFAAASALAFVVVSTPASALQMHMPGMTMPMPEKKPAANKSTNKKAPTKKSAGKKTPTKKATATKTKASGSSAGDASAAPAGGTSMEGMAMPMAKGGAQPSGQPMPMDHSQHGGMTVPMPMSGQSAPDGAQPMPMDHSQMDHSQMGQMPMDHGQMVMGGHGGHMAMNAALGPYPMERESSGTAWQPDTSEHMGLMTASGDWMLMAHGVVNFVYDRQSGARGEDKAFASGMLMGMAQHPLGNGTVQFKAMLSPDPLMGPSGYPLLLASGETANGRDRLIDRQHPHDFFMELSASISQNIGPKSSVFLYGGLPGEPAFGPPAFMHREAILDSPEAPISHHWLDSTHITFGVLTAGIVLDRVKLEVSRFNAREPDEHRWNIETGPLDSTSVRLSWNPIRTLSLQGSWGHFTDPEQLEPGVDQKRLSASALWADEIAPGWKMAATLAWGRKTVEHQNDDAYVAEASLKHSEWTIFGRGEMTENRELLDTEEQGPAFRVGKISLGAVRDFKLADHFSLGLGGLFALNFVPDQLAPLYGGNNPTGMMGFVRLKLD